MTIMKTARRAILATGLGLAASIATFSAPAFAELKVTLLGTGTPVPELDNAGPATLVRAGGKVLLFDAGRDVVRGLTKAGVTPGKVDALFVTHMHSDHLTGIPDLLLTGWLTYPGGNRKAPLPVYGPAGVENLAEGLAVGFAPDIRIRYATVPVAEGGEKLDPKVFAEDGIIYDEDGVKVTAFQVEHGPAVRPAYGYRVDHDGASVTISGDTTVSANLIKFAEGTDLLVHEVFAANDEVAKSRIGRAIGAIHVTPEQAGEVFADVKPKMAVFTHVVLLPPAPPSRADVLARARAVYDGAVEMGADGMTLSVDASGVSVKRP